MGRLRASFPARARGRARLARVYERVAEPATGGYA